MHTTSFRFRLPPVALVAFAVLVFCAIPARSDTIAPNNNDKGEFWTGVASVEVVAVHERPFDEHSATLFWAGVGRIQSISGSKHAWGGEGTVELRRYSNPDEFAGHSMSSYLGVALMDDDDDGTYVAITPGLKLSLSMETPWEPVVLEPYLSLSYPVTRDLKAKNSESSREWVFSDSFYFTFGFRLVFKT